MRHESARDIIAAGLAESTLDPRIPLGFPVSVRPERGPNEVDWYRAKHARGQFGKYWGLHCTVYDRDMRPR